MRIHFGGGYPDDPDFKKEFLAKHIFRYVCISVQCLIKAMDQLNIDYERHETRKKADLLMNIDLDNVGNGITGFTGNEHDFLSVLSGKC